jgi:hypothetical protein
MSLLALSAASTTFGGVAGLAIGAIPATAGTAISGNTGFTVPWAPGLIIVIWSGSSGAGACQLVNPASTWTGASITVAANGAGVFGPCAVPLR